MINEEFEIRTDIIFDIYNCNDFNVKQMIAKWLDNEGLSKRTSELYEDLLKRHPDAVRNPLPDSDKWNSENFVTSARCMEMVRQLKSCMDLDEQINENSYGRVNHYFFIGETDKAGEYSKVPQQGVILNKKVEIDRSKHPGIYRYLFALVYSKTRDPLGFLSYHFEEKFNRNLSEYKNLLFHVEGDNLELIQPRKRLWDKWIEEVPPLKKVSQKAKKFKSLFKSEEHYHYVIKELSKDDPEKWFDTEGNFIRIGRGNDKQGSVCDLLAILKQFGYFKTDIDLSKSKIPRYAKSCFGIVVGPNSSRIDHPGKPYDELKKRLKSASRIR